MATPEPVEDLVHVGGCVCAAPRRARRAGTRRALPTKLGVWPALALYFLFLWVEVVFTGAPVPRNIAFIVVLYSLVTWAGMAYYGAETWLRHGEAFSVLFGIFAKFAPTEVRVTDPEVCEDCGSDCRGEDGCVNCYECFEWAEPESRELNVRPWAVGLVRPERLSLDRLAFVVFMLAAVTMDGLMDTTAWVRLESYVLPPTEVHSDWAYMGLQTLGRVLLPLAFLCVYLGFSWAIRALGRSTDRVGTVAVAFVYSLVPIALAYQCAHYYTLLLIQGQ
ncbi:MAG: hypothetical protein M3281_07680, partial [Chloroflexota bacterium]|nr:hypothetical protein [Chloroflexota bacterium]